MRNWKHCISTTRVPLANKFSRMVTYLDELLPKKSHDLRSWTFRDQVTHQNHYICITLYLPMATKLGRMVTNLEGFLPVMLFNPLVTCYFEILKPLNLHYHNDYGHKTWYYDDLYWATISHKFTQTCSLIVLGDHVSN